MKSVPKVLTRSDWVQCYGCGWKGLLGESKESVYIDIRNPIPSHLGGNGKRFRCPECAQKIFEVMHYSTGSFAPNGHEYREEDKKITIHKH
jgi:hypothetical protein